MWLTLKDAGDRERPFRCIAMVSQFTKGIRPTCLSLLSRECTEEQRHVGKEICVVIIGRIRTCYLCFTYTPVSTVSFVLS